MSERKSGIDLLKVIMMLWIIMFHMANHSRVDLNVAPISWSWLFEAFCKIGGGVADCVFVLITGVLYHDRKIKISRILQLWCEVWFYSVVIGCLCIVTGIASLSLKEMIKMVFPVIYNEYPFFSAYIVLFLLIPFLNQILDSMSMERQRRFSWFLLLVVSIIPTFSCSSWIMTSTQLPMFIVLYVFGAGMGKYGKDFLWPIKNHQKIFFILLIALTWLSEVVLHMIGLNPFYLVWDMNKLPVVLIAIQIVALCKDVNVENLMLKKTIKTLSKCVFGVYLIHIHRTLKTPLLDVLFDNRATYGTWALIPQVIVGAMIIFVVCVVIDLMRIHSVERLIYRPTVVVSQKLNALLKLDDYCEREG